jgi:RNAse (barnase) inhibitor barstar
MTTKDIDIILAAHGINRDRFFIGVIDGGQCKTLVDFIDQVGKAFHFPDYFGENMDAVWDCIRDLEWIDKEDYALVIINYDNFLIGESSETKDSIVDFINKVKGDWANVPNYKGEDKFRKKAKFEIIYN